MLVFWTLPSQPVLTEHLVCVGHGAKHWVHSSKQENMDHPHSLRSLVNFTFIVFNV